MDRAVTACHLDDRAAATAQSAAELFSRHLGVSADFAHSPATCRAVKAITDVSRLRRRPSANFRCLVFLAPAIDGNFHL